MLQYKEQIIDHVLSNSGYRIHYKDRKFFKKIKSLTEENQTITSGQASLYDRLIQKYFQTALCSTGLSLEQLQSLPWQSVVVETEKIYTIARVSIDDNNLVLECPFKSKFVNKFLRLKDCNFTWNKKENRYNSPYSVSQLKLLHTILPKYFDEVTYCSRLMDILEPLKYYSDELIWKPTLKKVNNNYYIAAINQTLHDLLGDIHLDDSDEVLYKLSMMSIDIEPSIITDDYKYFVSSSLYTCDISQMEKVATWLKSIGIKKAILASGIGNHNVYTKHLMSTLSKNDIVMISHSHISEKSVYNTHEVVLMQQFGDNKMNYFGKYAIAKSIYVKNSYEIEVK